MTFTSPRVLPMIISISNANSTNAWRQVPHGGHGFALAETTAMRASFLLPSETALNSATRSEQHDVDHETSSTLHPVKTLPSVVSMAAPTL